MEQRRIKIAISFFSVSLLISSMAAFQLKAGQCPEVEAMKDFEMSRFLGIWHLVQGTLSGNPVECITFNVTKKESNRFSLTQLPHNLSSELTIQDDTHQARMNINMNESSEANFDVLVTDYDNYAGFFICKNNLNASFLRAAAFLSRTKSLSDRHYDIVKRNFRKYEVYDDDLTIVITCN